MERMDDRIRHLLDDAARRRSCAICRTKPERRAMARWVECGLVVSPAHGLFLRAGEWRDLRQLPSLRIVRLVNGLTELHPSWTFCGPTAAHLLGLRISYGLLDKVHVADPRGSRPRGNGLIAPMRIRDERFTLTRDIRTTTIERTALDCLRTLAFHDALAVGDAAVARLGWSAHRLCAYVTRAGKGMRGIANAARTARHVNRLAESGGESIVRACIISMGYVVPRLQVWIENPLDATHPFRADGLWIRPDGTVVVLEVDGQEKRTNPEMTGGRSLADVFLAEHDRSSLIGMKALVMHVSPAEARDRERLRRKLDLYGIPAAESFEGVLMSHEGSPMQGSAPAPGGAYVRDGWLQWANGGPNAAR